MTKDYAKQFADKSKQKPTSRSVFSWLLPLIVVIIIIVAVVFAKFRKAENLHLPTSLARTEKNREIANEISSAAVTQPKKMTSNKPRFEFYDMLPKAEVGNGSGTAPVPAAPANTTPVATPAIAKPVPVVTAEPKKVIPQTKTDPAKNHERYILQLSVFKQKVDAEAFQKRLGDIGAALHVEPYQVEGKTLYRVQAGPFVSEEQAKGMQNQLAKSKMRSIVRKL